MDDRRGKRRQKSFLRGTVDFDKRRGAMGCLIRDLSEGGARIILSQAVAIPESITLHIPQRDLTTKARVQWRRGDEIGLVFETLAKAAALTPRESELTTRIAELEEQIAALQRTIKQLKAAADNGNIEAA